MPLPEDGPAEVAGVSLPAGQRIYGWMEDYADIEVPAAWVTSAPMADAGDAWLALSAAHAETGLVPVLLSRVSCRAAAQHVRGRHPGRRRASRVRRRVRQVLGPADQRAGGGSCGRAGLALLVGLTEGKP